jgi:hypothetical protein
MVAEGIAELPELLAEQSVLSLGREYRLLCEKASDSR